MSTVFDTFAQRRPNAARRVIAAANLAACAIPAITVLSIIAGNTTVALVCVFAGILLYPAGYHAAAWRYGRRLAAAGRDALTGLPTRAAADELLQTATRTATDVTIALADVDWLKAINNNLGHAAGDQYLLAVAHRLAEATPANGYVVRHGGDEFAVVAPDTDPGKLAVAISAAMTRPVVIAGKSFKPRASVGIAASSGGDATYARACADAAMATAKAAGGARALLYQADRDGRPNPDGTRPLVRRRDLPPRSFTDLAWLPEPGDELVAVLWTIRQAQTIHNALRMARDRWEQAETEAQAGAAQPDTPQPSTPDRISIEPTPRGYRHISRVAAQEHAKYAQLAEQLQRLLDAVEDLPGGGAAPA
ncbi:GGDEF domain-containing protein [Actinomycetes bacterium KLBMP 9797]